MNRKTDLELDVVNLLIGSAVVVFILQWLFPIVTYVGAFNPLLGWVQPWRFLTASLLHAGVFHLAFNLMFLWILGKIAKGFFKQWQILAIYLLCAWGGSLGTVLWWRLTGIPETTVGASGAVLGLCAAVFIYGRNLTQLSSSLGGLLVVNIILGFVLPNVAWHAHLGGIICGAILGFAMRLVSTSAGRIGRKYLGDATIPDVVDRHKASQATSRMLILGNALVICAVTALLAVATTLSYTTLPGFL